jgi:two-component system sensor histidine kinase AtoS
MSSQTALAAPHESIPSSQELIGAFSRFSEASRQLEGRYLTLKGEVEQLRERLRQKDEEIAKHARLSMLGETAAAIAHEIRNPLCAMKLFLSLLRGEVESQPSSRELIVNMERTMESLNHVVENILHLAKDSRACFAPVNVHALLSEQRALIESRTHGKCRVTESFSASPFVQANEHGLRQVFANVFANAVEATHGKGSIHVSTRDRGDAHLLITIVDDGPGIEPSLLPKIFEPFVTAKREGTGLGLAVVQKILRQHGATICVANVSSPSSGAVVSISLLREGRIQLVGDKNDPEDNHCSKLTTRDVE